MRLAQAATEPSDEALCRAFLAGDEAAFGALVDRHRALVFSLMRRYASSPEDAADLAQQAFLRALEASNRVFSRWRLSGPMPFRAWLIRIALNLAKNHARQGRRWLRAVELPETEAPEESAQESLERAERERAVRAAVLTLPRRQREVLTLRVDAGLGFRDIAESLGITETNAKVNFHHAVKRLREHMAESSEEERP
ncbi:RNA polymerase sigma-70 factor, ECF subfamily [Cystobacter fuscus DSM 2262]|uniref:RNA polymerase sigma-70 factor, ECF subfamily n=1 Tax=Cystobacter fuscus (strain ATCC 25194 / DSM 2262 / NBRC 100088 / M29) TaxID=1242864 RepID=S9QPL0_CYSF2|nr:sigma-70 family RNA polymerase sigma factor [Cystobacter fuscus]EPX58523.1 RNA polymerase sigma-70 factor, ECF subfamily [Cystobacter fuscus DSM 2262]